MSANKLMSQDRIATLFERAAEGNRQSGDSLTGGGRARWLRTIDFTRPSKFTPDQENRLRRAHETFSRVATTKLAAEHRIEMDIDIVDVVQLTWSDAHGLAERTSMSATLETAPIGTKLLLTMDVPLLLCCIERLLGSPSEDEPMRRELTDIDLKLVRRIFDVFVESLSAMWEQLAEVAITRTSLDVHPETAQTIGSSEPTLILQMEARMRETTAQMFLLLPHASVQPVSAAYSKRSDEDRVTDPDDSAAVRDRLGEVDITVRAEVGEIRMPVREVLALKPGDVVGLGIPADAPMGLHADDVLLHLVRPGRHGRARAVQIVDSPGPS
jgi:flagellar motor switch protein FliM